MARRSAASSGEMLRCLPISRPPRLPHSGRQERLFENCPRFEKRFDPIFDAPAMRAPLTALRPTPPAPKITIVSPALTFAVFKTEPAPVTTPQPSSAAWGNGRFLDTTAS